MIELQASRHRAVCMTDDSLTTGSVGVELRCSFTDGWEGITSKVAVFRSGSVGVDVLLDEDRCTVPPEVLTTPGETLTIGVYGTDSAGEIVIPTVYAEAGRILRGAEPSGIEPEARTQPLIDQLLAAAQAARDAAAAAAEEGLKARHTADYAALFAETLNSGAGIPLDAAWEQGDYYSGGGKNNARTYRARTVNVITASVPQTLQAAAGYQFYVQRCNPDGTVINSSNWVTSLELSAGEIIKIVVRAAPEDTGVEADPDLFGAAVTIKNNILTAADKAEITAAVIADLPVYSGGVS